jgi:hypothetical protein
MERNGLPSGAVSVGLFDRTSGGSDFVCAVDCIVCIYRQTGVFEVSGRGKVEKKRKESQRAAIKVAALFDGGRKKAKIVVDFF